MYKYAIKLEYDGSCYLGYQIQKEGTTVQGELEKALAKIAKLDAGERFKTTASGRTDTGVHAYGQVVSFSFPFEIEQAGLLRALNSLLPKSMRVTAVNKVDDNFHARYAAISKTYNYRVDLKKYQSPFKRNYTSHYPYEIDINRLNKALETVVGRFDFTSFCSKKTDLTDLVREIYKAEAVYLPKQAEVVFTFTGNGFLYNMVRILVGTSLEIASGLKPTNELERLLEVKDRTEAGPTASPNGLYLMKVDYEVDPFSGSGAYIIE